MQSAELIRKAVSTVSQLRAESAASLELSLAVSRVKQFQARRFRLTYADLLPTSTFGPAVNFFLEELYSDRNFEKRDLQFSRIAGALQTLFPQQVVKTAVSLAQLHGLTEELDHLMAHEVLNASSNHDFSITYVLAWNTVGRRSDRERQLQTVLTVGAELDRLTRTTGLRMMLHLMRRPAHAAGLSDLQRFLERGFDTFASMAKKNGLTSEFLSSIDSRESALIRDLFAIDTKKSISDLTKDLPGACKS